MRGVHIPFVLQDELLMYTEEYEERRRYVWGCSASYANLLFTLRLIKKDADVRAVLRSFWNLTKMIKGSQSRYVDLHLALNKSVCKNFDEQSARVALVQEWLVSKQHLYFS